VNRPNIIYLHSHDTGRYVEPYGHGVPAPNLQWLAEEGVLFRQAFCAAPTCSPSRSALLTGQAAHSSGMRGLAHRGFALHDYSQHLVHTLRAAGYRSTLIGMQHEAQDPATIGYDDVLERRSKAEFVVPRALEFFANAPAEPFFASIGFDEAHRPFHKPGPAEDPRYTLPPAHLPDTPQTREDMAAFKASVRVLDTAYGDILNAIDAAGLRERTLVICTTDHGLAFPGMKCTLTDRGIGVLLIMRGPHGFSGGRVIDSLVSQIDIFPTICDLLGIDPPPWLQGRSLLPLIGGEVEHVNEEIYAGVTYHAAYEPQRAVRTQRWKYIRRFDGRDRPVLPNCDDSLSKDVWLAAGWQNRPVEAEVLYDLAFDPGESHNLANDTQYAVVLDDMRGRLDRWMRRTDDPLLDGPVPLPPGGVTNDPDALSPNTRVYTEEELARLHADTPANK
jgi:N-sulfoglucosamine sulfohydrolase